MKKALFFLLPLMLVLLVIGCGRKADPTAPVVSAPPTVSVGETLPENRTIRLQAAQSIAESGLMQILKQSFEAETPYRLDISANPNGIAVSVGGAGQADVLLVQQCTAVDQHLAANGGEAYPLLKDSYVLLGPASDPAGVLASQDTLSAFKAIAKSACSFVSLYDDSDLCRAETELWKKAGVVIGNGKKWYNAARLGQTASLHMADENGAYILSEKEAYYQEKDALSLVVLLDAQPELMHSYLLVTINGETSAQINTQGAAIFRDWLLGESAGELIRDYGKDTYGCALFIPETRDIVE